MAQRALALTLLDENAKDRVLLVSLEENGGVADLVKKKLATSNPFQDVDPIGKASAPPIH